MVIITQLFLLLALQGSAVNWNPKKIHLPADKARVKFQLYLPGSKTDFRVQQILLVWVPKLDEFPGRPGRQAIRLTMKDQKGRVIEVFEVPAIKVSGKANIGQVIGQGYLSFSLRKGTSIVNAEEQHTCIGLVSKDLDSSELSELSKSLRRWRER